MDTNCRSLDKTVFLESADTVLVKKVFDTAEKVTNQCLNCMFQQQS